MNTNESGIPTISARELREILFYLESQEMSIGDLRHLLFEAEDQDKQVAINFSMMANLTSKKSTPEPKLSADEEAKAQLYEVIGYYLASSYESREDYLEALNNLADDYASNFWQDPEDPTHMKIDFWGMYAGLEGEFSLNQDGTVNIVSRVNYPGTKA